MKNRAIELNFFEAAAKFIQQISDDMFDIVTKPIERCITAILAAANFWSSQLKLR